MQGRSDKLIKQRRHNVYPTPERWPEPTLCTECGAVYLRGRWVWEEVSEAAHRAVCPACRRIAGNLPAGRIEIKGAFFDTHREELQNLIRNVEAEEKSARPLERIMAIKDMDDHTLVTTTGVHIARRIGDALARAYKGELSFQYGDEEKSIRVYWERET